MQVFRPSSNALAKASLMVIVGLGIFFVIGYYAYWRSSYVTNVGIVADQPIPFSHQHHIKGMKMDCRFCHASVELTGTAGMPSTEVCMGCHSQILKDSPVLKPLRDSFTYKKPVRWTRVHQLPDFVYFNHAIHVHQGAACIHCHGQIDQMPLTVQAKPMTMEFCLECHRHPEYYLRPREQVFSMDPGKTDLQSKRADDFLSKYSIDKNRLTNCYECHR